MYFYCERCGEESDVLPENYILRKPKKLCEACSPKPFDGEVEVVSKVTYGEESNALRVEKQILVFRDGLLMEVQDAATIDWYDPHPNWT
jgi:DNA replicative helicase MCM subunit Mcm2 (Cdc46/Mcm family)